MDRLSLIKFLFDESAERYQRDIVPALAPLAADLIAYARPQQSDLALDVGTGTGIAARFLSPYVRAVIGIDLSPRSLTVARQVPTADNVHYVLADMHRLPFPTGSFSLVISSFGLNGTEPDHSLRALRKMIAPGGRLVLQEWGPVYPLDSDLHAILDKYALEEPGERMAALREWVEANPARWRDQLQDADDYTEWLTDLGFTVEDATEHAPVTIRIPSAEMYLTFQLAWTYRFEEVRAMDPATREAFMAESLARLKDAAAPDGSIRWNPVLFRITARKL